jgi:SAM-dependent methyltransferase
VRGTTETGKGTGQIARRECESAEYRKGLWAPDFRLALTTRSARRRDRHSEAQLGTARRLQRQYGLDFPLIHGDAEEIAYPDASFDFAISEYGACLWADPHRWVPEAARLLRPGGQLVFLTNSFLMTLCMPPEEGVAATDRLLRPAFGMYRIDWPGNPGVEFHLLHGDWIRLLRRSGFEVEDLIEVRPAVGAISRYPFVTLEWARQWPCEEVWKARKTR